MKSLMIFGAIVGFFIGAGFSLAGDCSWPTALWRACAAALILAMITRWWSRVWLESLRDAHRQRRQPRSDPPSKTKSAMKV
jgi:biopolymer transport protein ExbB/TolQ